MNIYNDLLLNKRIFDILASTLLITLSSPLLLALAIGVKLSSPGPIIFKQRRVTLNNETFTMYKFRSMRVDAETKSGPMWAIQGDPRWTRMGTILRKTSIDELPQLWNVLKGDMSLVGPRPLLMEYLPLYSKEQARRHNVRPGITGWAQVNGRNAISWEEKFKYDVWYVENKSFWLDMKIIWMTIKKVIAREGISADGEATMPKFTSSQD